MRKIVLVAAIALGVGMLSLPAAAQETAAVDPVAPTPSIQPIVSKCETVSQNPELADPVSGQCVTSTGDFIAALEGVPPEQADQAIADLVAAIAPLAQAAGPVCDKFDDEIAAAIRLAATRSSSPDQVSALTGIAQTVDECAATQTSALPTIPNNPASPG